jgi:hypothetical protein
MVLEHRWRYLCIACAGCSTRFARIEVPCNTPQEFVGLQRFSPACNGIGSAHPRLSVLSKVIFPDNGPRVRIG